MTKTLGEASAAGVARHLKDCVACSRYAERLGAAGVLLRDHHAELAPPAGFTARVGAALPAPAGLLGWAALRVLPATLALVLVLSGWCWLEAPWPSVPLGESATDDLLSWVLEGQESAQLSVSVR
jgi:hypothetical protein